MSLSSVRQQLADAINGASLGFAMTTRPPRNARKGDGWVLIEAVRPSPDSFVNFEADFSIVLIIAGQEDFTRGDELFEEKAVAALDALENFSASGLSLEPATVPVANSAFLALIISLTMEV